MERYFFLNSQLFSSYTFSSSIIFFAGFVKKNLDLGGLGGEAPQKTFWDFSGMYDDFRAKIYRRFEQEIILEYELLGHGHHMKRRHEFSPVHCAFSG